MPKGYSDGLAINSSTYKLFYISPRRNILLYSLLRKTIKSRWFMPELR